MKNLRMIPAAALAVLLGYAGSSDLRAAAPAADPPPAPVSLAGEWRFAMDRANAGMTAEWFKQDLRDVVKTLAATAAPGDKLGDSIQLPGILQGQGYGDDISTSTRWVMTLGGMSWPRNPEYAKFSEPGNVSVSFLSQPPKHYIGVAWYQRDIDIPADWAGKRVELFLERAHWQSSVWVDDQYVGFGDSLVAPHVTDLGVLKPGPHRLTIRVDNDMMYRQNTNGHSVSDGLGATWNGIVGRIELSATTPVWIADAQVFPDIAKKSALIKIKIGNIGGQAGAGTLTAVSGTGGAVKASTPVKWDATGGTAEMEVPYGNDMVLWDEFHPNLEHLSLQLAGDSANDTKPVTFGFREITHNDKDMLLNGHLINLRMTHDGGDFPLTGYPAMDVATWTRIFQLCKSYGLNGMRCHSWCPPEAAFEAADQLGFYLQPECGFWDSFTVGTPMAQRLDDETNRLLAAYGNHPSFILLSPSNESGRDYPPVWAAKNYQADPRRLYSAGTGNDDISQLNGGAQFAVMPHTTKSFPNGGGALMRTISSDNAVWLGGDYRAGLVNVHIPLLGHEIGQWCAYPDFDVIKEYTGYTKPGNFQIFRDSAAQNGVLDRNKEFSWASGKFQLMCYKEEIETLMRTPGMAGFQLLDLHDNTEQGTALVGVVDPLWQPKSYVTAAEFHRFAGPTVPLARLTKHTFTTAETLETDVELYHFGDQPITGAKPYWKLVDAAGASVAGGQWDARDIPLGKNIPLGHVSLNLANIPAPREYKLVVGITGASAENDWNIWVYPAPSPEAVAPPADVLLTDSWADAEARLAAGGKVLFTPRADELGDASPPLSNVPVFWNRQMNPPRPNVSGESMLGLWCDAQNPALAEYPTEGFCDWEWTVLVRGVHAINIGSAPADLRPIVSAVDDWNRNWKLGVIFEAKVGPGRLLVSAINLAETGAAAPNIAQLRRSLLDYMAGDKFQPKTTLTTAQVRSLWSASAAPATGPTQVAPPEIDANANAAPPA